MSARTVLTSTSGKKLTLSVYASGSSDGSFVTIGLSQGNETHSWNYQARAADLKIGSTGAGSLTLTSAQTGDRGQLDLKFSPTAPAETKKCGGKVAYKSRAMAVSGIAHAKTDTKGWGTVGSSSKSITFQGKNTVYWSYDVTCSYPAHSCQKSTSWSAYNSTATEWTYVSGWATSKKSTISGYRSVQLDKPAGASRTDSVTRSAAPPELTTAGDTATLTAEGSAGSLTIDGKNPSDNSFPCRTKDGKMTQQQKSWSGPATNGSKAFTVGAQIFGSFKVPNGSSGYINRYTY